MAIAIFDLLDLLQENFAKLLRMARYEYRLVSESI
jgi:hypothetical protein